MLIKTGPNGASQKPPPPSGPSATIHTTAAESNNKNNNTPAAAQTLVARIWRGMRESVAGCVHTRYSTWALDLKVM